MTPPHAVSGAATRAVILSGAAGVGKSTVAAALARELADRGEPFGLADLDTLAQFGPAPWRHENGVSFYDALKADNAAAVWHNFRRAGARYLVLAGHVDSHVVVDRYRLSLRPTELKIALLVAPPDILRSRLAGRRGDMFHPKTHLPNGDIRAEALAGVEAEQERLESAAVEDFIVVNNGSADEAARKLLQATGWL